MSKMTQKSIALPINDWDTLKEWSETCEISMSDIMRRMIKQHQDSITYKTAKAMDKIVGSETKSSDNSITAIKNIKLARIIDDELANDILKILKGTGEDVVDWIGDVILDARNDYFLAKMEERFEEAIVNGTLTQDSKERQTLLAVEVEGVGEVMVSGYQMDVDKDVIVFRNQDGAIEAVVPVDRLLCASGIVKEGV